MKMRMGQMVERVSEIVRRYYPPVPSTLSKRFIIIDGAGLERVKKSLEHNCYADWDCSTQEYQSDLNTHLYERIESNRHRIIPWLNRAKTLNGASVLEIGCGTGSSTVALAEQGARVTAIDIDEQSLDVAKERCRIYGVDVSFSVCNATEAHRVFSQNQFDFIVFYACLEHMTHEE